MPMTTGEKIHRIRLHRKLTQKELGDRIGLAANRVAQYEMGYRVPKRPLLEQMAQALEVSPLALLEPITGTLSDVMEALFWMDEEVPGIFQLTTIRRDSIEEGTDTSLPQLEGNLVIPSSPFPPTVLWTENGMLDSLFKEWAEQQTAYYSGQITHEQYFEWKLRWPMDSQVRGVRELSET